MGRSSRFNKDPQATLDYQIDWSEWLGVDTINGSTWSVPTGLTSSSSSYTTTTTTVWLASGTVGTTYSVVNTITTVGGRTEQRTLSITIMQR